MERLGVRTGDSRDKLGRSRFHCFNPATHIHGGYPDWYREYDKYGAKKGVESISDYAISFHYVSVEELYNLEFYVYHLRPYGIVSGLQELNRKPRPQDTRPLSTSAESLEPKVMPVKL
jgi:glycoprotein-N-acetylgalactosamine 3-beta-galactosyltransferase